MTIQTAANIKVVIARESVTGTAAATNATARQIRLTGSQGLELKRANIISNEKRDDGNRGMARLGGKTVDGSYNTELYVGGETSMLLEAILRSTWVTTSVIGFASMTTVAIGTNELVAAGGDWIGSQGLRVGDVFTVSGTSVSGNNNTRAQITALTSLTISVAAGSFTTLAAASTGTITRLRKLAQGSTPTRYTHTIEQYEEDSDLSELFLGCRLVGYRLSMRPGQMVTVTPTFMGMDRTILATSTSPYFSGPTVTTGLSLVADDAVILKSGVAVTTFTGFDLDFQITAGGQPVLGSFVSPDIFDNDLGVTGSITGLRSDFANLTLFDAETEFDIGIRLIEPGTAPKPCIGIYVPRVIIGSLSAPVGGDDGAKVETLGLIIGPKVAATGYDAGVATFFSSTE